MPTENFSNNSESELSEAIDSNATVVKLADAFVFVGSTDNAGYFQRVTLTHPDSPGVYEVIYLLGSASGAGWNGYEVQRAIEGSSGSAQSWPAGTKVSARVTAQMLNSFTALTYDNDVTSPPLNTRHGNFFLNAEAPHSNGDAAYSRRIQLGGFEVVSRTPSYLRPGTYSADAFEYVPDVNMARTVTGASYEVDLGDTAVSAWSGSSTYAHKAVVSLVVESETRTYTFVAFPGNLAAQAANSPTADEDAKGNFLALDNDGAVVGYWMAVPTEVTGEWKVVIPATAYLMLDEAGFICTAGGGTVASTPPVIGASAYTADNTFVNPIANTTLAASLAPHEAHRIPVTSGACVKSFSMWLDTAATGGAYKGRFYWKGTLFERAAG